MVFAQMFGVASRAQSVNLIGSWEVEITFRNGDSRSLRFEARGSGKGSFLLTGPGPNSWGAAPPSEAKWTQSDQGSVMISGTMEFPIGNVGRDSGTLVLKGKFETGGVMTGTVEFSPSVGDGPSKSGTFKAIRLEG